MSGSSDSAYGHWFHGMMKAMPWSNGLEQCEKFFTGALPNCPYPARGERDWDKFKNSSLFSFLESESMEFSTEVDFAFGSERKNLRRKRRIVDLCVFQWRTNTLWLVDWKTSENLCATNVIPLGIYRKMKSYALWAKKFYNGVIKSTVYSTSDGVWLNAYSLDER
jgi:hypothetical protein